MSDLHGDLPKVDPCELVLICGDILPLSVQANYKKTIKWLANVFKKWALELPCKKVIFIAGNHELIFPENYKSIKSMFPNENKVTYLCHEEYNYLGTDNKSYKIFGTPYCSEFGTWAFMLPGEELLDLYLQIPKDLDILMTHEQPYKYGDILLQEDYPWANGEHIGNPLLLSVIEVRKPKLQLNGHLHSCSHERIMIGETTHYNVSLKDESYNMVYKPLYLKFDKYVG